VKKKKNSLRGDAKRKVRTCLTHSVRYKNDTISEHSQTNSNTLKNYSKHYETLSHFRNNCVTFTNNFKLYSPLAAMSDPELAELKLSSLEVLSSVSLVDVVPEVSDLTAGASPRPRASPLPLPRPLPLLRGPRAAHTHVDRGNLHFFNQRVAKAQLPRFDHDSGPNSFE
jgi:hypothetical protein